MNDNIAEIIKNVKQSLTNCPNDDCGSGLRNFGTSVSFDNTNQSIVVCICPECGTEWYFCRICKGNFVYVLRSQAAAKSHLKRIHSSTKKQDKSKEKSITIVKVNSKKTSVKTKPYLRNKTTTKIQRYSVCNEKSKFVFF